MKISKISDSNSTSPLLTIITINFNNAPGLERTLRSLEQMRGLLEVECLFVDGGSTDGSVALAQGFYPPGRWLSEPDRGIYDAMNKGLALASGKYAIWINSGDELMPELWPALQPVLKSSEASIIAGGVMSVSDVIEGKTTLVMAHPGLLPYSTFCHQATFFRVQSARRAGGYSLRYKIASDRDLILRLVRDNERVDYIDLVIARFYEGGVSSDQGKRFSENFSIDLNLGLIGLPNYLHLKFRNIIYHDIVIPVWDFLKSKLGISTARHPWLLILARVFGMPSREL